MLRSRAARYRPNIARSWTRHDGGGGEPLTDRTRTWGCRDTATRTTYDGDVDEDKDDVHGRDDEDDDDDNVDGKMRDGGNGDNDVSTCDVERHTNIRRW